MPITDLDIIQSVIDLYNNQPFDHIINLSEISPYIGIRYVGNDTLVIYRGSTTDPDWARDLFAVPHNPTADSRLGILHEGFSIDFKPTVAAFKSLLRGRIVLGGHSLGASEALIGCGELIEEEINPAACIVFGEPKPGYQQLADIVNRIPVRSYKNCNDLVTEVPFDILGLDYVHPQPLIQLNAPPMPGDSWGILADHHSELYLEGMLKLKAAQGVPVIF